MYEENSIINGQLSSDFFRQKATEFIENRVVGWWLEDIQNAVMAKSWYLATLGVVAGMDVVGSILREKYQQEGESKNNFNAFLNELPDSYKQVELCIKNDHSLKIKESERTLYKVLRCGLMNFYQK